MPPPLAAGAPEGTVVLFGELVVACTAKASCEGTGVACANVISGSVLGVFSSVLLLLLWNNVRNEDRVREYTTSRHRERHVPIGETAENLHIPLRVMMLMNGR